MGWSFACDTSHDKAACIRDRIRTQETDARKWETIAHAVRGQTIYKVVEITDKKTGTKERYIGVDLIAGGGKQGMGWGYKDLEESMGPCELDCPLKFFDMVPDPGSYATEWRKKCREYQARKTAQRKMVRGINVGDTIILGEGYRVKTLVVVSVSPLRATSGGLRYRVPIKGIVEIQKTGQPKPTFEKGDFVHTGAFPGIVISDARSQTPCCEVWGLEHEMGSAYAKDMRKLTKAEFLALAEQYQYNPAEVYSEVSKVALGLIEAKV